MDRFNKITVPAGQKFRQLQKIVHDIKKNDSGIMSKFKKFQNEQVALICKTGKNTWDRLTSKPPPSVPPVDYGPDHPDEDEHWSDDFDSDYENPDNHSDSDTYVVPNEDLCDDSYEPPPSEQEQKQIPMAFSCSGGEYADNKQPSQQKPWPGSKPLPTLPNHLSSKPKKPATLPPPSAALKAKPPPTPDEEEADYVVPVDDEEDNYIEPTEESTPQPVKPPVVNRSIKPTPRLDPPSSAALPPVPLSPSTLDVYEVPEEEEKSSPALIGISKPLPPKPVQRPPGGRPYEQNAAKESHKPDRNVLPLPRQRPPTKSEFDNLGIHDNGKDWLNIIDQRDGVLMSTSSVKATHMPSASFVSICNMEHISKSASEFKFPSVTAPSPFPRITKKLPNPAIPAKPSLPDRDHLLVTEDKPIPAERRRSSTHEIPLPPIPKPLPQKPPVLPRSTEPVNCASNLPRQSIQGGFTTAEQNAGVHGKPWYMASSDRKTAEEALYKSHEDGSFLVRKSSGQDSKQPYTLVVFYNKRVYNIPVRFIESTRQYALGKEKSGEERFNSVAEIIENHQRTALVLIDSQNNTKDSTKLRHII